VSDLSKVLLLSSTCIFRWSNGRMILHVLTHLPQ
jgi:hypothetical protein